MTRLRAAVFAVASSCVCALAVAACSSGAIVESQGQSGDGGGADGGGTGGGADATGDAHAADSATGHDSGSVHDTGAPDTGAPEAGVPDAPWVVAVPASMPAVQDFGGPLLSAPVFQSITFSGYDQTAQVDAFVAALPTTAYWPGAVAEYGVGTPTIQPPAHLAATAPTSIDDSAVQSWLVQQITLGNVMAPTSQNVYLVFYPSTTTVTLQGTTSCTQFGGYHGSTTVNSVPVAYAVVPECSIQGQPTLQTTTGTASHELIEACTDPFPFQGTPAFLQVDPAHMYWEAVVGGGEVGDMCAQWPNSFFAPPDLPYLVQRTWSNSAAKAGRDPCQPELPKEVYFNSVPLMTDSVQIQFQGGAFSTLGIAIAPGGSKTIPVQLYSEGPIGPWNVQALNVPQNASYLTFTWNKTSGQNGDTLQLTITVAASDPSFGGEPFLIVSSIGQTANYWLGYVGQ
jgi:hypothetical protein